MTDKEYRKILADARRSVSRKYGFRQSSYINFKVESGYFFCLYFMTGDVRLTFRDIANLLKYIAMFAKQKGKAGKWG